MFYYEMSLNVGSQVQHGNFYNSLSYNKNVILRFFRDKFSILSNIFFTNDTVHLESDMDICFDNYISNTRGQVAGDSRHFNTKKEILNILVFLIDNYQDNEILNYDVRKFIIELIDLVIENRENIQLIDGIKQICNFNFNIVITLLKAYIKTVNNSNLLSSPNKILFLSIIKHLLNKTLHDEALSSDDKRFYYNYFLQFYKQLEQLKALSDTKNILISTIKELIYKNVDNQSFRNPIVM
jgi:hypothetical protein